MIFWSPMLTDFWLGFNVDRSIVSHALIAAIFSRQGSNGCRVFLLSGAF
jgi:hypothetical protein